MDGLLSPPFEQREHVRQLEEAGDVERRPRTESGIGARREQLRHVVDRLPEDRRAECGLAAAVRPRGVGTPLEQGADCVGVVVVRRQDQQRVAWALVRLTGTPAAMVAASCTASAVARPVAVTRIRQDLG
jgi:hypothetical protein